MFISVKDLTSFIDQNIDYVNEAIANKSNFDDITFNDYIEKMNAKLSSQLDKLKYISSNEKLIAKYTKTINDTRNLLTSL